MIDSFETARLNVKKLSEEDTDFIFELLNSPDWLKYIGDRNIKTKEDALAFIKRTLTNEKAHVWVIREKERSNKIGILTYIDREGLDNPDFGFALLPDFYKKGYAFEASIKMLECLKSSHQNQKLLAIVLEENVSSILLLQKLGFEFEKKIELNQEILMLYSTLL